MSFLIVSVMIIFNMTRILHHFDSMITIIVNMSRIHHLAQRDNSITDTSIVNITVIYLTWPREADKGSVLIAPGERTFGQIEDKARI